MLCQQVAHLSHHPSVIVCTRDSLFASGVSAAPVQARETEATAELDNRGLLQLQRNVMREQDQQLEQVEKTVINTKVGEVGNPHVPASCALLLPRLEGRAFRRIVSKSICLNCHASCAAQHIALAIGEEVDLQTRLLDDLHDDVEVTQSRTKAATSRIRQILKDSSQWRGGFCIFVLIVTLVLILVLIVKLSHVFL